MGKGKKPGEQQSEHVSRPLASLKDPSAFGPPPKHVNYHGGAALPNEITPHTGGLGAPLSPSEIESANRTVQGPPPEEVEQQQARAGPPLPYRADRTGLQTSHLPPPPVHRNIANPPSDEVAQPVKPKPGLPPRLPSRQQSTGVPSPTSPPPPSYEAVSTQPAPAPAPTNGGLNMGALNRLGNAGVAVPGFGIGKNNDTSSSNPWKTERSQNTTSPPPASGTNTLSELQSRFNRMNPSNSNANSDPAPASTPPLVTAPTSPQPNPTPPSWQQSQSALRTATNFHQNPSSVSAADAQSAAATAQAGARSANAFREKHADTISAAGQRANAFDQKYKVKSRFEKFLDKHAPLEGEQGQQQGQPQSPQGYQQPPTSFSPVQSQPPVLKSPSPELAASISRKPPPPPPPKKPKGMHGNAATGGGVAAPPVPLGTKPGYS